MEAVACWQADGPGCAWKVLSLRVIFFPAFTTEDERDGASTASPLQAFPECSADDLGTPLCPYKGFPK